MPKLTLKGKQTRHLRSLGHHLKPVVLLGKEGLTEAIIASTNQALLDHELIKVKLGAGCEENKDQVAARLEAALNCTCVQKIGNILLLYSPHPDEPVLRLPE